MNTFHSSYHKDHKLLVVANWWGLLGYLMLILHYLQPHQGTYVMCLFVFHYLVQFLSCCFEMETPLKYFTEWKSNLTNQTFVGFEISWHQVTDAKHWGSEPKLLTLNLLKTVAHWQGLEQDPSVPRHTLFHMASLTTIFKDMRKINLNLPQTPTSEVTPHSIQINFIHDLIVLS